MAGGFQQDQDEFSGINVTPLVDVVLVLLVIFMITAPTLYQNALQVQLPKTSKGDGAAVKETFEVTVDYDGVPFVDGKPVSLELLGALAASNQSGSALILADKKAQHGKVIEVIDALKANGVTKFSFGIETQDSAAGSGN